MSRFSLITEIDNNRKDIESRDPNAPNITYQRYDLDVGGSEMGVLIPIRECDNFETTVSELDDLTTHKLKKLVRDFRGLIAKD